MPALPRLAHHPAALDARAAPSRGVALYRLLRPDRAAHRHRDGRGRQ
jgi:hypothetical protein